MALGNVIMTDTDGNISSDLSSSTEKVCGLLFDISAQPNFWTKGAGLALVDTLKDNVVELNSLDDADKIGITAYSGELDENQVSKDFLFGIPYYHIKHFFTISGGTGRLFVMFADCSQNWNAVIDMQKAAHGTINQFGVWTEKNLWKKTDPTASTYSIQLVGDLQSIGESLANTYHSPVSILLNANSAKIATTSGDEAKVTLSMIPTCVIDSRYVTVLLGQGLDTDVSAMQASLASCTPVGNIGAALGCLTQASVAESIGWVQNFDLINYFPDIEFGFGDSTLSDKKLVNTTKYSSLSAFQLEDLDDRGYVFLMKYNGLEGHIYFSGDQTCSNGDYRTIARNRTINKSRRSVRTALLPYVNSPIKVDPSTGYLSSAQSTIFSNIVNDILQAMVDAEEISGFSVKIPSNQNVLKNDTLLITYILIPIGTSRKINVTEGLSIKK
ncbi:DUF2586 family protein [Bacteroides sp. 224]|uniref:DUF2586 family protein n=1 Tax=Bacteroides sp. 224 TaxID=2302936 RepID=UPI0013D4BFC2|nr:DUF2586 family protein [Bacteroides sp. 224]NDV63951.1 hypothetical protein [Bacteroides sp. 224]